MTTVFVAELVDEFQAVVELRTLYGVFSTRKKAEEAIKDLPSFPFPDITEMTVDEVYEG